MFKVDDYIIYSTTGVCKVTDIVSEKNRSSEVIEYYVLDYIYGSNTVIKIPTANKKIFMRNLITLDEAKKIVDSKEFESIWIDNEKERNGAFKAILKEGDFENWFKLAKSIHEKKKERIALGKKLNQSDEGILKSVEKLLSEELSVVLEKDIKDIVLYI